MRAGPVPGQRLQADDYHRQRVGDHREDRGGGVHDLQQLLTVDLGTAGQGLASGVHRPGSLEEADDRLPSRYTVADRPDHLHRDGCAASPASGVRRVHRPARAPSWPDSRLGRWRCVAVPARSSTVIGRSPLRSAARTVPERATGRSPPARRSSGTGPRGCVRGVAVLHQPPPGLGPRCAGLYG